MFTPLAAGKKVYAQGSFAPTRGTVDPQGYIQRELAKQQSVSSIGRYDGQSDTRSGLAQAALQRMKAVAPGQALSTQPQAHNGGGRTGGGHTPARTLTHTLVSPVLRSLSMAVMTGPRFLTILMEFPVARLLTLMLPHPHLRFL